MIIFSFASEACFAGRQGAARNALWIHLTQSNGDATPAARVTRALDEAYKCDGCHVLALIL